VKKTTPIDANDTFDFDTRKTIGRDSVIFDEEKFIMDWLKQKDKTIEED